MSGQAILAPMAGVSDVPQRELCSRFGAALTVSEMVTADVNLWSSRKTASRLQWGRNCGVKVLQIAGAEPALLADAARAATDAGADIIDINMGCPAKKVCAKAAGSALLKDEPLVASILQTVVAATRLPVTLKIRTGWDTTNKNALSVARIAEDSGISALTIHGRTRACRFHGEVEYDTIAEVTGKVRIPVIANGDIDSAEKALWVLAYTGAAGVMIGRGAQGNPWLFAAINAALNERQFAAPTLNEVFTLIQEHISAVNEFYGEHLGPRIARKVYGWYLARQLGAFDQELLERSRQSFNTLNALEEQLTAVQRLRERLHQLEDQAA